MVLSYVIGSMKIKQTIFILLAALTVGFASLALPTSPVAAQGTCGQGKSKVSTAIISGDVCKNDPKATGYENNTIWKLLIMVINIMTAGVGILAVGGIVYASILYTTARDTPDQAQKAKKIILNVVIGIIMYGTMYLVLNFLIPGGIFK